MSMFHGPRTYRTYLYSALLSIVRIIGFNDAIGVFQEYSDDPNVIKDTKFYDGDNNKDEYARLALNITQSAYEQGFSTSDAIDDYIGSGRHRNGKRT